jgi:endonuclease-3
MAAPSKAQLLTEVYTLLKKRYKLEPRTERMSILEAVVYGICHEGTTREQANQALSRFKDDFFDWNEVRVSSLEEIQGVLAGLPDPEGRAYRVRRFLRQLFEKTYGFALDALTKKPLKEAIKALQAYEVAESDYVVATVVQQALGGHAIPVDVPTRRGLARLGIADADTDDATLRAALERAVPKNRGGEFVDLMEELTHDTCVGGEPDCPRCELKKICPTGQARLASGRAAAKGTPAAGRRNDTTRGPTKPAPAGDGATGRSKAKAAPALAKPAPAKAAKGAKPPKAKAPAAKPAKPAKPPKGKTPRPR